MGGETQLDKLLKSMSPQLVDKTYVFCCAGNQPLAEFTAAEPLASFVEEEGLTLVLEQYRADELALKYDGVFRCISLKVHSSLHAVGLTAAISNQLAQHNISANVIAAYYHDHVFVPHNDARRALALLQNLATNQLTDDNNRSSS